MQGKCDINIRNGRLQTPLILAVSQGHTAIVELLVEYKCEVYSREKLFILSLFSKNRTILSAIGGFTSGLEYSEIQKYKSILLCDLTCKYIVLPNYANVTTYCQIEMYFKSVNTMYFHNQGLRLYRQVA